MTEILCENIISENEKINTGKHKKKKLCVSK
jgi:hypothetical protein